MRRTRATPLFEKKGKVSVWLAVRKPNLKAMEGVDILKDLCGVPYYDLDEQDVAALRDTLPRASVAEILKRLSYSSSFLGLTRGRREGPALPRCVCSERFRR